VTWGCGRVREVSEVIENCGRVTEVSVVIWNCAPVGEIHEEMGGPEVEVGSIHIGARLAEVPLSR